MKNRVMVAWFSCVFAVLACTSDPNAEGTTSGSSSSAGGPPACTGCAATEGCLRVLVRRGADDSSMPWVAFSGGSADGSGTLVVSATETANLTTLSRVTVANASFTSASAGQDVMLTCVRGGAVRVRAFLDDDGDADATDVTSSDFLDTCQNTPTRYVDATVVAASTTDVGYQLQGSCD